MKYFSIIKVINRALRGTTPDINNEQKKQFWFQFKTASFLRIITQPELY